MNLQEEFLRTFFTSLNGMTGDYCVIHSYEELPFHSEGDIDIAISNINKNDMESLMINVCNKLDWRITQRLWYDVPECFYYVLSSLKDHSVTLKIDLLFDENAIGYTHYSTEFLTAHPLIHNNIKHSNATAEFCYKLTKRIVKGYFKESDDLLLNELFKNSDKNIVSNHLTRQYGKKNAQELLKLFNSPMGFTGQLKNQKTLHMAQKLRYKYGSFIRTISILKWQIQRVAHRFRYPCGAILQLPATYSTQQSDIKSMLSCASIDSFRVITVSNNISLITRLKCLVTSTLLISADNSLTDTANIKLGIFKKPISIALNKSNNDIGSLIKIIDEHLCQSLENRMLKRLSR
ncbi:hypothetical protein KAR91_16685 [Candidatus Pacearchaeota archaeon]|nr:hypothetical protein [Candidatus Pacearchaeota archaeon]